MLKALLLLQGLAEEMLDEIETAKAALAERQAAAMFSALNTNGDEKGGGKCEKTS